MAESDKHGLEFLEQFEPDLFWQQHARKIIWTVVAVMVVGAVIYLNQRRNEEREEAASLRLVQAANPSSLQQLADEYRGKSIGASALLKLADEHFAGNRYVEAAAAYQQFVSTYPIHSLCDAARLGHAASLEAQGDFSGAKQLYIQLASQQSSYVSVAAKIGAARCAEAQGQVSESKMLYEELLPVVTRTPWEGQVSIRWAMANRLASPASTNQVPQIQ